MERNINTDPYNSLVFGAAGDAEIYLVGGYIRDLLANRESRDRDYAVSGSVRKLAEAVALATDGRLIPLGRAGMHRVVLKDGGTLDFSPLQDSIEKDLSRRDFTINAIAWSPKAGWIDPVKGRDDLGRGLIRMVNSANLELDTLRVLRAYRIAAELSFEIESETRSALRRFSSLIHKSKSERITSEFFKILNLSNASYAVEMALQDGLLPCLINSSYPDLERKVKAMHDLYRRSFESYLNFKIDLREIFSQGLRRIGLMGLEVLLEGLPEHLFVLSMKITRNVIRIGRSGRLLDTHEPLSPAREVLFEIFETAAEASPELLMIRNLPQYAADFEEYRRIEKCTLLSAEQVSYVLGGVSGPAIGDAIRSLRKAEFMGDIKTPEDATAFLRKSKPPQ